jgi:hypothetical protein
MGGPALVHERQRMPQLTFNKEECPSRIKAELQWSQLRDEWSAHVVCYSQTGAIQESFSNVIRSDFTVIELCMAFERLFEDWIQLTPGYCVAMFRKALSTLNPSELPSGLQVVDDREPDGVPLGGLPTYRIRTFPPRHS